MELGELILGDGTEAAIFDSTSDCVFPEATVEIGGGECSDATSQTTAVTDFPGHEQRKGFVCERRGFWWFITMKMTVKYIETKYTHVYTCHGIPIFVTIRMN